MFYSIFYFLMFGSTFLAMQYINLYYKSINISSVNITIIICISTLISIFSGLFWGNLFDKTKKKHFVLYTLLLGTLIFFSAIAFFDKFMYILILNVCFSIFYYSLQPISTTITLENCKKKDLDYGKVRIFGTIGFCVISLLIPMIKYEKTVFVAMFIVVILMIITFTIILKTEQINLPKKEKYSFDLKELFSNKQLIIYMMYVFVITISLGAHFSFFGIYFTDELAYSKNLFGILTFFSTLSEIPFLLFSKKIIKRCNTKTILLVSGFITSIRWLLCFITTNGIALIFIHMLHGFGFIVLMTTMNIYINENKKEKYKGQTQSIFFIGTLVFSKVLGSVTGGVLPMFISQRNIFILNFLVCIIATFVLFKTKTIDCKTSIK